MSYRAHILASVSLTLGALAACVDVDPTLDPPGPAGAIGGEPTPAAVDAAAASYRVPLPADLASLDDVAAFALPAARAEVESDRVTVAFTLPAGLLGVDAPVELTGPRTGELAAVSGPLGEGTCRIGAIVRCDLAYRTQVYPVDLDAVARYWRTRGDAAIDRRLIVSSLFDADPLGVLAIPLD